MWWIESVHKLTALNALLRVDHSDKTRQIFLYDRISAIIKVVNLNAIIENWKP